MRNVLIIFLIAFMPGCAVLTGGLPPGAGSRKAQDADRLLAEGNFAAAREVWQRIARERKGSEAGERAAYRAALTLVHPKNPARNFRNAANEFETLLRDYPSGKHAGEAAAWISAAEIIEQTRVNELLIQVDVLTKRMEETSAELQKTGAARDTAMRERDALTAEKNELWKRIDGLLLEKSALITEKTALVQERDGLA
ncbi:MAG TPA: hypothetical protein VN604_07800, partial [Nitrospirota bacterium]|nr:hypothetical protein [Nitrospirota bacterium]